MTLRQLFLWISVGAASAANGQVSADSCIVDHLRRSGRVRIEQPQVLNARIGKKGGGDQVSRVNDTHYLVTPGYRIQVFSGNDQRKSKEEALRKERLVKEQELPLETYVTFNPPTWRLRVGNYRSYEEADQQLRKLRKLFPAFGKEMYIVKEEVQFPLDRAEGNEISQE